MKITLPHAFEHTASFNESLKEEKVKSTRVIVILGALVFILYSIMDFYALPKETFESVYPSRVIILIILTFVFFITFKSVFDAHYTKVLMTGYISSGITISICLFYSQPQHYSFDLHFAAFIILFITAFAWSYLPIKYSVLMSISFITVYAAIRIIVHQDIEENRYLIFLSHIFYLISVAIIGAIAQYIRDSLIYKNLNLKNSLQKIADEQTQEASKQQQLANLDVLTGIANRRHITECLRNALIEAEQSHTLLTLIFIDLNGFKQINDRYGHDSGDKVLEITAKRLSQTIREGDFLARLGGDEFLIGFKTNHFSINFIDDLCQKIKTNVVSTIAFNGQKLQVGASIGIANYPADGTDIESLIKVADENMYCDKKITKRLQTQKFANKHE